MTSEALVAIVEEEMSMSSIVVVVVDIHAIVVVARDDILGALGLSPFECQIKARRMPAGMRC